MILKNLLELGDFGLQREFFFGRGIPRIFGLGEPAQLQHRRHQQQPGFICVEVAARYAQVVHEPGNPAAGVGAAHPDHRQSAVYSYGQGCHLGS